MLRGVDLTDEQKASIKAIHDEHRQARTGPPADAALRRDLEAEVFAEAPDAQKIATLQQQLVQAQSERLAHEIAVQQKVAAVLTADQRAKVRERLSQAPAERRGGFERRGAATAVGLGDRLRKATWRSSGPRTADSRTAVRARIQSTVPRRSSFACVWIVGLLTIALRAQQAGDQEQRPPTFRTGTNVVRVDVSVLDRDGKPVRSLTQTTSSCARTASCRRSRRSSWSTPTASRPTTSRCRFALPSTPPPKPRETTCGCS